MADPKDGQASASKSASKSRSKRDELTKVREDVEFQLPEFDEDTFIRQEVRDARLGLITLGYAVVAAVVTRAMQVAVDNLGMAFLLGLALAYVLKPLFQFTGADLEELGAKNWLGLGAIYFFAWLGFWTLLMNGPFG